MSLTPEQFNKLATKEDLKNFATKEDLNEKFDQVLTAVDGLAKTVKDFHTEMAANQGAHDRFEGRIKGLEKKQDITQFA